MEAEPPLSPLRRPDRRALCGRCRRPAPPRSGCLCAALPDRPVALRRSELLVVQHPHEARRANRSLPFLELCLQPGDGGDLTVLVARRLTATDALYRRLCADPTRPLWVVFPDPDAISLAEARRRWLHQYPRCPGDGEDAAVAVAAPPRVAVLLLDATWRHAREMYRASQWPPHATRVRLEAADLTAAAVRPRRFAIRNAPRGSSEQQLSTAECAAVVLAALEDEADGEDAPAGESIYDTIMRPLDLMVQQWQDCAATRKAQQRASVPKEDS